MYLNYYHLKRAPFHITPDPAFFFLSPHHKTALGAVIYGIEQRQGFVAITGEVGLGKTIILHAFLERVDPRQLKAIYIFNANVSFANLLKTIAHELGYEFTTDDVFEMVRELHQLLIDEYRKGRNVALIIDEAQHIPLETLENLRMLSNLETATQKLVQIVLVGQPEFDHKLEQEALRQLKQRLVLRVTLTPLSRDESVAYIQHRLAKVTTTDEPIFTPRALKLLVQAAHGSPRVLNILCTNALIAGFGYQQKRVTAKIVRDVIADCAGQRPHSHTRAILASSVGMLLLASSAGLFLRGDLPVSLNNIPYVAQRIQQRPNPGNDPQADRSVTVRAIPSALFQPAQTASAVSPDTFGAEDPPAQTAPVVSPDTFGAEDPLAVAASVASAQDTPPAVDIAFPAFADTRSDVIRQVRAFIHQFFPDGGDFRVNAWLDKGDNLIFTEGDKLVVHLATETNAYLQVDYYQADGQVIHLLPHHLENNLAAAGQTFILGKPESSFQLGVSPPFGEEILTVIASQRPLSDEPETSNIESAAEYLDRLTQRLEAQQTHVRMAAAHISIHTKKQ